jgi:hypothetical protein
MGARMTTPGRNDPAPAEAGASTSSAASWLEFLLTGANYRWDKRRKVRVQGWRNLYYKEHAVPKAVIELTSRRRHCAADAVRPESRMQDQPGRVGHGSSP